MKIEILERPEYKEDSKRIQKILEGMDIQATLSECEKLWLLHSDSMAAGWMTLPKTDAEVYECIEFYIGNTNL